MAATVPGALKANPGNFNLNLDDIKGFEKAIPNVGSKSVNYNVTGTTVSTGVTRHHAAVGNKDLIVSNAASHTMSSIDDDAIITNLNGSLTGNNLKNYILGSTGNNNIKGQGGNDWIDSSKGNDTVDGGAGNDTVYGGAGNDSLEGGTDNDKLYGEEGNDTVSGGEGNDSLYGGVGTDTLNGGKGNDYLNGGDQNDTLNGDTGNDRLFGDSGNDKLNGGEDNDQLLGGKGNDTMDGGIGKDTLNGGTGDDVHKGGLGDDVFVFNDKFADGNDQITDFTKGDRILIGNHDADGDGGFDADDFIITDSGNDAFIRLKDDDGSGFDGTIKLKNVDHNKIVFNDNNDTFIIT